MSRPRRVLERICRHCDERWARRSNGLCDRCNTYLGKYDYLPSEATLVKMARRFVERQIALGA